MTNDAVRTSSKCLLRYCWPPLGRLRVGAQRYRPCKGAGLQGSVGKTVSGFLVPLLYSVGEFRSLPAPRPPAVPPARRFVGGLWLPISLRPPFHSGASCAVGPNNHMVTASPARGTKPRPYNTTEKNLQAEASFKHKRPCSGATKRTPVRTTPRRFHARPVAPWTSSPPRRPPPTLSRAHPPPRTCPAKETGWEGATLPTCTNTLGLGQDSGTQQK